MNESLKLIQVWKQTKSNKAQLKKEIKKLNFLKKSKQSINDADNANANVFTKLSCLDCANCCSSIPPLITKTDKKRIAKHLNMGLVDFENKYIHIDEDGDEVFKKSPCVFLEEDNTCSIYDIRPKACRQFPHTEGHELYENLDLFKTNIRYCPAAFHILKEITSL